MSDADKKVILSAIQLAHSMEVLRFLGDALRLQKIYRLPHTRDDEFMSDCRDSFKTRHKFLATKESKVDERLRQQHVGDHFEERSEGEGDAPGLQGVVRDREQALLDLGVDQGEEGRVGEVS